jgi:hypothetical protein
MGKKWGKDIIMKKIMISMSIICIMLVLSYITVSIQIGMSLQKMINSSLRMEDEYGIYSKIINQRDYNMLNFRHYIVYRGPLHDGMVEVYDYNFPIAIHDYRNATVRFTYVYYVEDIDGNTVMSGQSTVIVKMELRDWKWVVISVLDAP